MAMADEIIQIVETVEVIELPRRPRPAGIFEHYCEHEGCKEWGSFGYERASRRTDWFCFEHRDDGEAVLRR
jgi:hypothetical protein